MCLGMLTEVSKDAHILFPARDENYASSCCTTVTVRRIRGVERKYKMEWQNQQTEMEYPPVSKDLGLWRKITHGRDLPPEILP